MASTQRIALLGLGEAGSLIAADLLAAGVEVYGYDPDPARQPVGVKMVDSEGAAASRADLILSVNWASAALEAARAALRGLGEGKIYAELNTSSPAAKREVAAVVAPSGALFADVALMSNVPGKGVRTPMLVAGPGAERFADIVRSFGTPIEALGDEAGAAAQRKLLRSVFMKGFGAVVVEALEAARAAGLEEWMVEQIQSVLAQPGEARRFDAGTHLHAVRRWHEMEAALQLLTDLGVPTYTTEATVASLQYLVACREQAPTSAEHPLETRKPVGPEATDKETT